MKKQICFILFCFCVNSVFYINQISKNDLYSVFLLNNEITCEMIRPFVKQELNDTNGRVIYLNNNNYVCENNNYVLIYNSTNLLNYIFKNQTQCFDTAVNKNFNNSKTTNLCYLNNNIYNNITYNNQIFYFLYDNLNFNKLQNAFDYCGTSFLVNILCFYDYTVNLPVNLLNVTILNTQNLLLYNISQEFSFIKNDYKNNSFSIQIQAGNYNEIVNYETFNIPFINLTGSENSIMTLNGNLKIKNTTLRISNVNFGENSNLIITE